MILSKNEILKQIEKGNILTSYNNPDMVKNQSIDVRLGRWILTVQPIFDRIAGEWFSSDQWVDLDEGELQLLPGVFYLAHTEEFIGTKAGSNMLPSFKLKSSAGRQGIMHTLAGHGDVGFCGRWAMEFTVSVPLKISRFTSIGQIYFQHTTESGDYTKETGSYQDTSNFDKLQQEWKKESILPKPLKIIK